MLERPSIALTEEEPWSWLKIIIAFTVVLTCISSYIYGAAAKLSMVSLLLALVFITISCVIDDLKSIKRGNYGFRRHSIFSIMFFVFAIVAGYRISGIISAIIFVPMIPYFYGLVKNKFMNRDIRENPT
ncbi:MAG: hypothetical protein WCW02_02685 [Candidatus Buchananbacteria bacterium]